MLSLDKQLENLLRQAWSEVRKTDIVDVDSVAPVVASVNVIPVKEKQRTLGHGDFSSNFALIAAGKAEINARDLAHKILIYLQKIISIGDFHWITKVEIAGPGFINFFVDQQGQQRDILAGIVQDRSFFTITPDNKKSILLEFISANPTGPLHVGHGRGAAYGAALVNLLKAAGYQVTSEYYVNDAGRQMDILALSVWLRYLAIHDQRFAARFTRNFLVNAYQGDYIISIARALDVKYGKSLVETSEAFIKLIDCQVMEQDLQEAYLDQCIQQAKSDLQDDFAQVAAVALHTMLDDIKGDLADSGVHFDHWFSERALYTADQQGKNKIDQVVDTLKQSGFTYERDGALWFRASQFGDSDDRVLKRDNGLYTYFAADIAYHSHKMDRGYSKLINIWGADHHGYIPRVKAALKALGYNIQKLEIILVQFANLRRNGERVSISTRTAAFVSLRELREEVGNDAVRLFYLLRKAEQHMDFDLDLAKSETKDNPVYYLQYAHARIKSIFARLAERAEPELYYDMTSGLNFIHQLNADQEKHLIMTLSSYRTIISKAADKLDPLILVNYLRQLAADFHAYYNEVHILPGKTFTQTEKQLLQARLVLCDAVACLLRHGLSVLGIHAPDKMAAN